MLGIGAYKQRMPRREDALPGRSTPMPVHNAHHVHGRPLRGSFDGLQRVQFGMGCFWGAERKFWSLPGVVSTAAGYAGGQTPNPTYREVCSGQTGHAEVVQIDFDPAEISYEDLLRIFFTIHDPTTRDRQGNDIGSQYRSVILAHDAAQEAAARAVMAEVEAAKIWPAPLVTEIVRLEKFWPAEREHEDYFERNPQYSTYPDHAAVRAAVEATGRAAAWLSGHVHWNTVTNVANVQHITIQSLSERFTTMPQTAAAYAILTIEDGSLSVEVFGNDPFFARVPFRKSGDQRWVAPLRPFREVDLAEEAERQSA